MREEILSLLVGNKLASTPVFSGLIHITTEGLEHEGLLFHEIQHDAKKMAQAAASTFKKTGFPSAALPLDIPGYSVKYVISCKQVNRWMYPG